MKWLKNIGFYAALLLSVVWTLLPIYWLLRLAIMSPVEATSYPPSFWPEELHWAAIHNIFGFEYTDQHGNHYMPAGQAPQIILGLKNSFIVATWVMILTIFIIVPLSYAFSRFEFKGKNALLMSILFSVSIPPVSTLIPFYIMFSNIGLTGTLTGLVIVNLTVTIPFITWMLIGYFKNLPPIERLAQVDGFSRMGTLIRLVIPMASGGIAVAAVVAFLFAWNEFVFATSLVNGTEAATLPTAVSGFLFLQPQPGLLAASLMLSLVPAALVVYFLQSRIADFGVADVIR